MRSCTAVFLRSNSERRIQRAKFVLQQHWIKQQYIIIANLIYTNLTLPAKPNPEQPILISNIFCYSISFILVICIIIN